MATSVSESAALAIESPCSPRAVLIQEAESAPPNGPSSRTDELEQAMQRAIRFEAYGCGIRDLAMLQFVFVALMKRQPPAPLWSGIAGNHCRSTSLSFRNEGSVHDARDTCPARC